MSSTDKSLGGREYLVGKLKERGFSRRQSVLVLNIILDRMIYGLNRGWEVEFPFGKLTRIRKSFGQWWDAVDDWPANREPCAVEWELSREGWKQLFGAESAAEEEWRFAFWKAPEPEKRERRGRKKSGR